MNCHIKHKKNKWSDCAFALPAEARSEIHANALILRDAITEKKRMFSQEMAEEVCTALYFALIVPAPKEQR